MSLGSVLYEKIRTNHDNTYTGFIVSYTKFLYNSLLNKVEKGSTIVDIGIGNGEALLCDENIEIIKKKQLQIYGYDIDKYYIEKCKKLIIEKGVKTQVFCFEKDLSEGNHIFSQTTHYLYFSNSYSVLKKPVELLKNVVKLFNPMNVVISLTISDNILDYVLKPTAKFFMWGIDFGRVMSEKKLLDEIDQAELVLKSKELTYENDKFIRTFNIYTYYFEQKKRVVRKF